MSTLEYHLCVIANPGNPLAKNFRQIMKPYNFGFSSWDEEGAADQTPYWLLFTPYYGNGCYQTRETIWAKHIELNRLNKKLIVATTMPSSSPYHIDLLQTSGQMANALEKALLSQDKWAPAPSFALDLMDKLRKFIAGHSTLENLDISSAYAPLTKIRADLIAFADGLRDQHDQQDLFNRIFYGNTNAQLHNFTSRWERYYPFFEGLPMSPLFDQIGTLTEILQARFDSIPALPELSVWIENTLPALNDIYTLLQKIESYARD